MAGQHDQVNILPLGQTKYRGYDIASQDVSPSHHALRTAASDSLCQVVRCVLLRQIEDGTHGGWEE